MQQISPRVLNNRKYPAIKNEGRNQGLAVDLPPLQITNIELAAVNGDNVPDSPSQSVLDNYIVSVQNTR